MSNKRAAREKAMSAQGLNSDINIGSKRLHVQTSVSETAETIITNVFDSGRIVETHSVPVAENKNNGELEAAVREQHQEVVSDIELLFYIAEKVRQVKHPVSCNKLGLVLLNRGFIDEAIAFFELGISIDHEYAEAYNNLGLCYFQQDDLARAEEMFRKGLNITRNFADLNLNLGRVYIEKKAYHEAVRSFEAALEINNQYFEAHYFMARALLLSLIENVDNGQLPPASIRAKRIEEHMSRAASLFKPFVNEDYDLAKKAIEDKNFSEAEKHYSEAFTKTNRRMDLSFENEFFLKFMYGGKGKDNQFIGRYVERLKYAINDYPEYADLHNNLGIAYLIMCRNLFLKALEEFRKALRINPLFKKAEKNLKLAENDGKGFLILLRAILK